MGCWNVTSMTIFSNITEIGMNAFSSCYALENVDFSKADKLEKIGGGAFGYCDKLAEIHLEYAKNLKIIDEAAFYNNGIEKVFLPDGVETIGKNALKRKDGQKTYVYGRTGSTAEEYCKNENAELFSDVCVFRDYEGVYLVHPNYWEEYYKTGEGNYQVELEWPVSTDNSGVEWKSSDESIATVDSKGVVTRKKKGTVTITAVRGEFSDSVVVKILKESFSSKDGVWKYRKLTDSTIAICGYMGEGTKKVTIPSEIDGYTVTRLQQFYDANWEDVRILVLPETLEMIDSDVLASFNYSYDIIIPKKNNISYVGENAFGYHDVYGPENFIFRNYVMGFYREDNKLYLDGINGNNATTVQVKHMPSTLDENVEIKWDSTDTDGKMCTVTASSYYENAVEVTRNSDLISGTVTVSATVGEYTDSYDVVFDQKTYTSEKGHTYRVIDENEKKAELVHYSGSYERVNRIPETVDGYTIVKISDNAISSDETSHAWIIPDSVTEISDDMFGGGYKNTDEVLIGSAGSAADRYVKRHSDTKRFCTPDQMILEKGNVSIVKLVGSEWDYSMEQLSILYAPDSVDTTNVAWLSSNDEIASVSTYGAVTAQKQGSAVITAKCGELTADCIVTVSYKAEGFYYTELSDGTLEITGCYDQNESEEIQIPEAINGQKVTVIGENAFPRLSQDVTIPSTVTTIKKNAFEAYNWYHLQITIPESVKTIEENAVLVDDKVYHTVYKFYGLKGSVAEKYAEKYTDIIEFIEDKVVIAGDALYKVENEEYNVQGMLSVGEKSELSVSHLPMNVDKTKDKITWKVSDSKNISIEYSEDSFEDAMTVKVKGLKKTDIPVTLTCTVGTQSVTIPFEIYDNTVYKNGEYIYTENNDGTINITGYTGEDANLSIPDKIEGKTVVSLQGFADNDDIQSVTIPRTVTEIQYYAFKNCVNLANVTFETSSQLKNIGKYAFEASGLKNITIPNSVSEIGAQAFGNCSRLENVTLSKKLKGIEYEVFYKCVSLKSITIPENVTYIAEEAFCESGLTTIIIPKNVESIGYYAFRNSEQLKKVVIKNKAVYIGKAAFMYCAIESLTLEGTDNQITGNRYAFSNNKKLVSSSYRCEMKDYSVHTIAGQ